MSHTEQTAFVALNGQVISYQVPDTSRPHRGQIWFSPDGETPYAAKQRNYNGFANYHTVSLSVPQLKLGWFQVIRYGDTLQVDYKTYDQTPNFSFTKSAVPLPREYFEEYLGQTAVGLLLIAREMSSGDCHIYLDGKRAKNITRWLKSVLPDTSDELIEFDGHTVVLRDGAGKLGRHAVRAIPVEDHTFVYDDATGTVTITKR